MKTTEERLSEMGLRTWALLIWIAVQGCVHSLSLDALEAHHAPAAVEADDELRPSK